MLYENYQRKITKLSAIKKWIKQHRISIIIAAAIVFALLVSFLSVKGIIYTAAEIPETITYGEKVPFKAHALFGRVKYEYAQEGTDEWTPVAPRSVGKYQVRAKSNRIFGAPNYSGVKVYKILPKAINIAVSPETFEYGERVPFSADLMYDDSIDCAFFHYEDLDNLIVKVTPDSGTLKIIDSKGVDVTSSYIINVFSSEVNFLKRAITVTVGSDTAVYDGTALAFDGSEVSKGSLARGDNLLATFDKSRIDAGVTENTAEIKIASANGYNVTNLYDITVISGKLTVEKRPIYIETKSAQKMYDGQPLVEPNFKLSSETSLLSGHRLELLSGASPKNAGTFENLLVFGVFDGEKDVTNNYSFLFPESSKLKITPRTLTVKTESANKTYDGLPLTNKSYTIESALKPLSNHTLKLYFSGAQTTAGKSSNTVEKAEITEGGSNVTKNYDFEYICGDLTVYPSSIKVRTATVTFIYNGKAQSSDKVYVISDIGLGQGDKINAVNPATITDVGEVVPNEFSVKILNSDQIDVSDSYIIGYEYGTLTMNQCRITVETGSEDFYYNGDFQFCNDYTISHYIADGQTSHVVETTITKLKNVENMSDGNYKKYDNVFAIKIFSGQTDVTKNYNITYSYGKVSMLPKIIQVQTGSKEFIYNGKGQFYDSYEFLTELENGYTSRVNTQTLRILTEVERWEGKFISYENDFKIDIYNSSGILSHNFKVEYTNGTIVMLPRPIAFTTNSNTWVYDGEPHFDIGLSVTLGSLADGHELYGIQETATRITNVIRLDDGSVGSVNNQVTARILKSGRSVKHNYDVSYFDGTLTILPRKISVTTKTNSWEYDALPHSESGYTFSGGSLVKGHYLELSSVTYITNVIRLNDDIGSKENVLAFNITDGQKYADGNYQISYLYGTLSITPRSITVRPSDNSKEYDTEPLICWSYSFTSGKIVDGQWVNIEFGGSQTEIGSSESTITTFIVNSGGDVTYNYNVSKEKGVLNVYRRTVYIYAGDASKIYDGKPLSCSDYQSDNLLQMHTVTAETSGSRTAVGISPNIIIKDSVQISYFGTDVSEYYNIKIYDGQLHVGLKKITLKTASNEKEYDGKPLTDSRSEIIGELIAGDTALVNVYGSITYVGETENYAKIQIENVDGDIVTDCYLITYNFGILTVTGYDGSLNTDGTIDREPSGGEGGGSGADKILFKATSNSSNKVYFRVKSFGDYNMNGWSNAKPYLNGNINALQLMSIALSLGGKQSSQIFIEMLSRNQSYMLPYYSQDGFATLDDTRINVNFGTSYFNNYIPYKYNSKDVFSVKGTMYEEFERDYYEYVCKNYLQLPETTRIKMLEIAAKNNLKASNESIISDVARFVQNAVKYDLNYNQYLGDIAVYFFTNAKTGICQHYATAATAMFRALGIPARYTIGFVGDMSAGKAIEVSSSQAHAWVEVYLPGAGWVQIEVTGAGSGSGAGDGSGEGDGQFQPDTLTIKPIDVNKLYDGAPLFAKNEVEGFDLESLLILQDLLDLGHRYKVSVTGSRTDYGVSESIIQDFVLYDKYGNNVTDHYNILYKPGRIRITNLPINIHLYELEKNYDGITLSYESQDYWVENLPNGFSLEFILSGSLTNSGMLKLSDFEKLPYTVYDENYTDVTNQYSLIFVGKPLRIYRRAIEITSASAIKTYDGTPLINNTTWLSKGFIPSAHYYEATVNGNITDIGTIDNIISNVEIFNNLGAIVTQNYRITTVSGVLKVDDT